jgi:predicted ATPase
MLYTYSQIQSAALKLIPPEKQDSFRGEIGNVLNKQLDPEELDKSIFEVVTLRNYAVATISSEEERKELATMNLEAGLKASEIAAFDAAAVYFKAGHELMGEDGWANDQEMMIKLCSEGANACFISNDLDTMHKFIDEVISKDISVEEKFRAYEVKALAKQGEGKFGESLSKYN